MNKFRWPQEPKRNIRHEEMQLIGVLDRCTQILREDRIFIRNRIKENDSEVLSFFKPLKNINMQNLQINLRKYLNNVKASMKMQQLMKFKENHHQTSCTCQKNGKGCTDKQNQSKDCYREPSRDAFKEINGDNAFAETYFEKAAKPQTAIPLGRFERSSSLAQLKSPSMLDSKKMSATKTNQFQKCSSTKQLSKQTVKQPQTYSNQKKKPNTASMRHKRSHSSAVADNRQPQWTLQDLCKTKSPKFDSYAHEFKSQQEFEFKATQSQNYQPSTASYTVDPTHLKYIAIRQSQEINDTKNVDAHPKKNSYRGDSYDNLFTSPELLMECRKYIEKVKLPLPKLQVPVIQRPSLSNTLVPPSVTSVYSPHFQQIMPQTHVTTIESAVEPPLPKLSDHYKQTKTQEVTSQGGFETLQTNAESKIESHRTLLQLNKPLPDLGQYYAEDIIDILFYNREGQTITATDFAYIIYSNFADTYPLEKLFEITDADKDGRVSIMELGDWLNRLAMPKHNSARTLFDLIDMDKVGRVTYEEYQRFLNQISQSERESFELVKSSAERVFKNADVDNTGSISYWPLYLSKNTWEFQEFSNYLEQFEFSVEP